MIHSSNVKRETWKEKLKPDPPPPAAVTTAASKKGGRPVVRTGASLLLGFHLFAVHLELLDVALQGQAVVELRHVVDLTLQRLLQQLRGIP